MPQPSVFQSAPAFPSTPTAPTSPTPAPAQPQPSEFQPLPEQPLVDSPAPIQAAETHPTPHKLPKHRHQTGHAGLVGFIVFILLTGLLVSPFIPGKIFASFPGSSQSSSSGDQSLACISTPSQLNSSTVYNSRLGSPVTYAYSTTTTQHALCDGKQQSAITGHTSQFNPLGLLLDIVAGLAVAIVVAKVWHKIFGSEG